MSKTLFKIMLGLYILTAVSCSMPETKIYSLYVPAENSKAQQRKQVMITLRVQSPRYLAQPYVAHRLSAYQLDISRYAKWDSAPSEMVREIFRDSLSAVYQDVRASNFSAEGSYILNVNLKRFEKVDDRFGEVMLDAVLSSAEGKEIYRVSSRKTVQLESADNDALAKGLSSALSEVVQEVVSGLGSRI